MHGAFRIRQAWYGIVRHGKARMALWCLVEYDENIELPTMVRAMVQLCLIMYFQAITRCFLSHLAFGFRSAASRTRTVRLGLGRVGPLGSARWRVDFEV